MDLRLQALLPIAFGRITVLQNEPTRGENQRTESDKDDENAILQELPLANHRPWSEEKTKSVGENEEDLSETNVNEVKHKLDMRLQALVSLTPDARDNTLQTVPEHGITPRDEHAHNKEDGITVDCKVELSTADFEISKNTLIPLLHQTDIVQVEERDIDDDDDNDDDGDDDRASKVSFDSLLDHDSSSMSDDSEDYYMSKLESKYHKAQNRVRELQFEKSMWIEEHDQLRQEIRQITDELNKLKCQQSSRSSQTLPFTLPPPYLGPYDGQEVQNDNALTTLQHKHGILKQELREDWKSSAVQSYLRTEKESASQPDLEENDEIYVRKNYPPTPLPPTPQQDKDDTYDAFDIDQGELWPSPFNQASPFPVLRPKYKPANNCSNDEDINCPISEDITLLDYQNELADPALKGDNVIIVAPTGSGKRRVAFKIIQEHIKRLQGHGIPKVAFLVNHVALANQQGNECKKLLPMYKCHTITGDSQRNKNEYLKDFMDTRDILIVTAQVLLDALVRKEIESISRFSLIIFDECNHTQANHPFNQIMGLYMELKFSKTNVDLPQIVGLASSVGVGKARNVGKAVDHIKRLMANLDAHVIRTVKSNIGDLREYVSMPDEETKTVPRRSNDVFGNAVIKLMTTLEMRMAIFPVVKEMAEFVKFEKELKAPAVKGNAVYTQWASKLRKEIAKLKDAKARKFLQPCLSHLEYYNNALIIYNDARLQDAMRYLEQEIAHWKDQALNMDQNETIIYEAYKKLKKFPLDASSENPKLEMLREIIMTTYNRSNIEHYRGIVFVKTRELARAIVRWMKDTPGLRELNPTEFVGQSMSADKGRIKVDQDDALEYFREGKHKLIVATSVAEEGLDITKCNLVIRYDHMTNEISKVQSRGRDRAAYSKYVGIAEENTGMAEKEELNMIREVMMRNAINQLQAYIGTNPDKFQEELFRLQEEATLEQHLSRLGKKRLTMRAGQFDLKCFRCGAFVCMSDSVKKIKDAHHVVVDETLKERVKYSDKDTRGFKDEDLQLCGKMSCKECGGNLGVICIYKRLEFPVLKIENCLVVDVNGRQTTCKQWKKAPFVVEALEMYDYTPILINRGVNAQL